MENYSDIAELVWTQVQLGRDNVFLAKWAQSLADYFGKENPRFDSDRFFTACGLGYLVQK